MFAISTTNNTNTNPTNTTTNPTNTNPTTTTSSFNGGLATEEELELNTQALSVLRGFAIPLSPDDIHTHFQHPTTAKKVVLAKRLAVSMSVKVNDLERQRGLAPKRRFKATKKNYNLELNSLLGIVLPSSPLRNLLFVNEQLKYVSKRDPHVRKHVDFVDAFGGTVGDARFLLHTKGPQAIGGGRTEFDTSEACLSAMRACIEGCVDWETHVEHTFFYDTRQPLYGLVKLIPTDSIVYGLKIHFVGSEYWVRSDDPRLRHILCAGNPPRVDAKSQQKGLMSETDTVFVSLYPHYAEFLRLVKAQIKQIVRNSHSNEGCPISIIPCCRIEPACSGETYTRKFVRGGSKRVACGLCRMDLCAGGCGRIYHGNTPCEVSLDEASAAFIQETSKPCPRCGIHIHKSDGCNHMTCTCRCEFCWLCGVEMPRDVHRRYRTDIHFGVRGEGVDGGCRQFS